MKEFEDLKVVDDLNLEIKRREVFGFLGPNGAGKTTSIKMMVGLLEPTSGRVLFDGAEVRSTQKGKIGVCPQDLVLWNTLTGRENLTFMARMYEIDDGELHERIDRLLTLLSLSDKADQVVSKLSGGMKRRLNIALSLVHDPGSSSSMSPPQASTPSHGSSYGTSSAPCETRKAKPSF